MISIGALAVIVEDALRNELLLSPGWAYNR
jgi:hypothetical protein